MSTAAAADMAIDLSHVSKTYRGKVHALRGVSMRVRRGEVYGLLGPNGAGKSTLVKILMTVVRPTRCEGTLLGARVGRKETLRRVGYLPEHHRFPDYLTGAQVLDFYGALAKVPRRERRKRAAALLDMVGMTRWAGKRVRTYSKGMRQRVGVAQALANDPELVLLDEPTDGVDPVGRRDIRNILLRMKEEGRTVFLNSHLLSELEMVCDRVAIMVQGNVTSEGTIDELTRDRQRYEIEFVLPEGAAAELLLPALPVRLEAAEGGSAPARVPTGPGGEESGLTRRVMYRGELATGEAVTLERTTLAVGTTDAERVQGLIDALRARGVTIRAVRPVRPSLEDLFMSAVTDPTTGEALKPGAAANGGRTSR